MNKQKQLELAKATMKNLAELIIAIPAYDKCNELEKLQLDKLLDARQAMRACINAMETL